MPGFGHFFKSDDEADIWRDCLTSFGVDDRVFHSEKQLEKDVRKVSRYLITIELLITNVANCNNYVLDTLQDMQSGVAQR